MPACIIRGSNVITHVIDRFSYSELPGGAVYQEDGLITEVGEYELLRARHPYVPIIGNGKQLLIPGLVNGHHHIGLTPIQLGVPDLPLELWNVARMVTRSVDPYLDTLVSAFEMIASGVTTVQHLQGWLPGSPETVDLYMRHVLRAYDHVGMRVSFAHSVRDQNILSLISDDELLSTLPDDVRAHAKRFLDRYELTADEALDLFRHLHHEHLSSDRIRIQLAPTNLHWCSDHLLERIGEMSESLGVPMHMHLLETRLQLEYARRRTKDGAISHLHDLGLLNSRLTLGHAVWLSNNELDYIALAGTKICHNCSSNLRLRDGVARLNDIAERGIPTAIGIDEAGLNDDRDMLAELRLVLRIHRHPGLDEAEVPTIPQVFKMASEDGVSTTPWERAAGTLAPGKKADMVLIDWESVSSPYLDELSPPLEAFVQRAKPNSVVMTMCNGEVLYRDGVFTRVDQSAALAELRQSLTGRLTEDVIDRRALSTALMPYMRRFYEDYLSETPGKF